MVFIVATFYCFVKLPNCCEVRNKIKVICDSMELKGTILLAEEGINGTIVGNRKTINNILDFLYSNYREKDLSWRESTARYQPFSKMKVKLKKEIVNFGVSDLDMSLRGEYINPENWDEFISRRDEVLIVDTRNVYEIRFGRFKNAIDPNTQYFREFPQWANSISRNRDLKIAMYCTGGIRCEKSTAYMKSIGFNDVYHLKGGILSYLERTSNKNGNWEGECFVFDNRVAVNDLLYPSDKVRCLICSNQVSNINLRSASRGHILCSTCRKVQYS